MPTPRPPHPAPPLPGTRRRLVAAGLAMLLAGGAAVTACDPGLGSSSSSRSSSSASASSSGGQVTVRLDVVQQGAATLAIVPVTIEGHGPYPFILDTGASTSGINSALAQQLGLPDTGRTSTVSGVVSSSQVHLVRISSWSVAGVHLEPAAVGALSFAMQQGASPSASSGRSSRGGGRTATIAGLLGSDQLSRFGSITLDYDRQQLRFTPGRSS